MTNEEYIEKFGRQCPVCRSENFSLCDNNEVRYEGLQDLYDMICLDCKSTWTEVFELVLYKNLTENNEEAWRKM